MIKHNLQLVFLFCTVATIYASTNDGEISFCVTQLTAGERMQNKHFLSFSLTYFLKAT